MPPDDSPPIPADDITDDLNTGRVLDLAELYAADCIGNEAERAIDQFLCSGPASTRTQFLASLGQTREALMLSLGSLHHDPPPGLLHRIMAHLPPRSTHSDPPPAANAPIASKSPATGARAAPGNRHESG